MMLGSVESKHRRLSKNSNQCDHNPPSYRRTDRRHSNAIPRFA